MAYTSPGETRKQIYGFVREQILNGTPPTTREVQHAFGFRAVQSARLHLEKLVIEGKLTKPDGKSRSYLLPEFDKASPPQLIPMLGRVQAGELTEAMEDPPEYIMAQTRFDDSELFALTVEGESMRYAGILPGDMVIVRRQQTAIPGDIVVALVGEETTVKRYRERGRRVELHPENDAFNPIFPADIGEPFSLLGKVIEVRRSVE
tara:strand:+ start:348 stop:962 length:615 start_codon:yes stop_codon:yes gene_type:complete